MQHTMLWSATAAACIAPGQVSFKHHLHHEPHYLAGGVLKSTVEYLLMLDLVEY